MGYIKDMNYKNLFLTPEEGEDILQVFITGHTLSREMFNTQANKHRVASINIVSGNLEQKDFNGIIDTIKLTTDKPTCIAFIPVKDEKESTPAAYKRYKEGYINQDKENPKHFPDNVQIYHMLMDVDNNKDNYKKRKSN
jgi:hypothetical protein